MEEVALALEHAVADMDGQETDAKMVCFNSCYIIFMITITYMSNTGNLTSGKQMLVNSDCPMDPMDPSDKRVYYRTNNYPWTFKASYYKYEF